MSKKQTSKACCDLHPIIQEFYSYLMSYILNKVKNKTIAEDLVQEVMVKLIETHQRAIPIDNIKAWLFQVSRHVIHDYYKKNKLEFNINEDMEIKDESYDMADEFMEITNYIIPMIKLLPDIYAIPLMRSDIDHIPQKQIAKELDLNLSNTKMRIQRGRQKLRELFVECCELELDQNGNFISCSVKTSCTPLNNLNLNI